MGRPRHRSEAQGTGNGRPGRDRGWVLLAAIVVLALALRLTYLAEIRSHPLFTQLTGDPAVYHAQALGILRTKTLAGIDREVRKLKARK